LAISKEKRFSLLRDHPGADLGGGEKKWGRNWKGVGWVGCGSKGFTPLEREQR